MRVFCCCPPCLPFLPLTLSECTEADGEPALLVGVGSTGFTGRSVFQSVRVLLLPS